MALRPIFSAMRSKSSGDLSTLTITSPLAIKPGYVEARNNLGAMLQTLGRLAEAIPHYEKALAARPDYAAAHKNLGNALGALNRHQEAAVYFEQALALNPDDIEAHIGLGNTLLKLERPYEAIAHFEKVLALNPANVDAHNGLGSAMDTLGRSEQAIVHYQSALAIKPADVEAHSKLGDALLALGRLKDASAAMERALALSPRKAGYYRNLANAKRFAENDPHFAAMKELTQRLGSLNEEEQIDLHFALGKAYGDLGAHAQSFQHMLQGNALMRQRVSYDEANALGRFERMRKIFTADLMNEKKGLGEPSAVSVFIIGMPRSGTTLIEQILASHPKVFGAGELREMASLAEQVSGPGGSSVPEAVPTMSGERLRRLGADYLQAIRRLAPEAERITDKNAACEQEREAGESGIAQIPASMNDARIWKREMNEARQEEVSRHLLIVGQRLLVSAEHLQRMGKVVVSLWMVGLDDKCLLIKPDGLVISLKSSECDGPTASTWGARPLLPRLSKTHDTLACSDAWRDTRRALRGGGW